MDTDSSVIAAFTRCDRILNVSNLDDQASAREDDPSLLMNLTLPQGKAHRLSLDKLTRRKPGIYTVAQAASIKHTDWAHEQEIRLLAPKCGALPVFADGLKRVHFVRTDGGYWASIMALLFGLYPQVETVHWQFGHGKLSAITMPSVA